MVGLAGPVPEVAEPEAGQTRVRVRVAEGLFPVCCQLESWPEKRYRFTACAFLVRSERRRGVQTAFSETCSLPNRLGKPAGLCNSATCATNAIASATPPPGLLVARARRELLPMPA